MWTVNSCEAFWAVLKRRVLPRFTRLQILERADRSLFMGIVEDEAKIIEPVIYSNLTRANAKYIASYLA